MQLGEMREKRAGSEPENDFTKTVDPSRGEWTILGHHLQAQLSLGPCHVREQRVEDPRLPVYPVVN